MIFGRQGLFLSIPGYADELSNLFKNTKPTKKRPFLVIDYDLENNEVIVVNVTTQGIKYKSKKSFARLSFSDDYIDIYPYDPPFSEYSYAKVNEVYAFEYFQELDAFLLADGKLLDEHVFNHIVGNLKYKSKTSFRKEDLMACNKL